MVLHLAMHKINLAIHELKQISVLVILAPKFRAKISHKVTLSKNEARYRPISFPEQTLSPSASTKQGEKTSDWSIFAGKPPMINQ